MNAMQSVKVSDSHPPDAWDQQARSLLAPGVCDLFVPLFSRWVPCFIYLRPPQTNPPHPSHRTPFFLRQTQAQSLKLIHGVNVIFLPDFPCVSFPRPLRPIRIQKRATSGLPCLQSTQAEEAGVHRLPSLLPWSLLLLYLHNPSRIPSLWI